MSRQSWWQKLYWTRLAKPIEERSLFRFLVQHPITSVLEVGVGQGDRMKRIAKLANLASGADQLRYIGVDEFESAHGRPFLTLKQAHRLATQLGFKASLIPGAPSQALPRVAHKFGPSDLIVIDGGIDLECPTSGPIGGWLNRLAHSHSTVIASHEVGGCLSVVGGNLLDLPLTKAA
jgi:hypothetical protein